MTRRRAVVVALLVIVLLALAGAASAAGGGKARPASPPEQAKAKGHAKHAVPEPAPPADPAPTPPPSPDAAPAAVPVSAPAPAPAPAPAHAQPPPPVALAARPAGAGLPAARLASEPASPARAAPTSPPSASLIDARSDAASFASGASAPRAPSWSGAERASPGETSGPAAWWIALAWALPFAGVGGVAAVLVARRRTHLIRIASAASSSPRLRMSPVSPDDLEGILKNGHVAVDRGALGEAIAWFDRAIALSPSLGVAWFCKGVCLAANGQVADAYGALRSACDAEPSDASYRVHLARVALALGRHTEAMDALALVAQAMPELGPAILDDPQLAGLRDHPRFLMICGAL